MKDAILTLAMRYEEALREFAVGGGEAALERAYELGRSAVTAGLGVLDIAAVYQEALLKIILEAKDKAEGQKTARAAADFFIESLSPFDMAQRGYRDANATVVLLNDALQERKRIEEEIRKMNDELRSTRDAAVQASRAKSTFLANMSHELRTPLNAIIGYSEMLQDDAEIEGRPQVVPDLQKIQIAARHLLLLINEILDFAKIEAGKVDVRVTECSVHSLIEDVVMTTGPLADRNRNAFIVETAQDIGIIRTDETKLRQILVNLVSNAFKFTKNGTVTLNTSRGMMDGKEWLVARVIDTGIGMSSEQMENLFQDFYQAHTGSNSQLGGTGLGLAISRRFCQMLGGTINVDSEPGQGTTFTVIVPVDGIPPITTPGP